MVGPFSTVNMQPPDNSGMEKALGAITEMVSQMAQMMQMMMQQMQQMQQVNQAMMQKLDGKLEAAAGHGQAAVASASNNATATQPPARPAEAAPVAAKTTAREVGDVAYTVDEKGNATFKADQLRKLLAKLGALGEPAPAAKPPTNVNPISPANPPNRLPPAAQGPGQSPAFVVGPTTPASPFVVGPGPAPAVDTSIKITGK